MVKAFQVATDKSPKVDILNYFNIVFKDWFFTCKEGLKVELAG